MEQDRIAALYTNNPEVTVEFENTKFKYSDYNSVFEIEWSNFLSFREKNNNMILITKEFQPYIFSKSELGEENYNATVEFVKHKIIPEKL